MLLPILFYLFANVFEPCQHIIKLYAICIRHALSQLRCDDALHNKIVFLQLILGLEIPKAVIQQQTANLIARQRHILAFSIANCGTHAVCIRIGCYDQVRPTCLGLFNGHFQCIDFLWIGQTQR